MFKEMKVGETKRVVRSNRSNINFLPAEELEVLQKMTERSPELFGMKFDVARFSEGGIYQVARVK